MNVTTMGELAFSTSYVPGVTSDEVSQRDVVRKLLDPANREHDKLVGFIRRLFYDAYVACSYDIKQRLERKGDEGPRRLDDVERAERRRAFLAVHSERGDKYWEGERKASDDLIDAYVAMWEAKEV